MQTAKLRLNVLTRVWCLQQCLHRSRLSGVPFCQAALLCMFQLRLQKAITAATAKAPKMILAAYGFISWRRTKTKATHQPSLKKSLVTKLNKKHRAETTENTTTTRMASSKAMVFLLHQRTCQRNPLSQPISLPFERWSSMEKWGKTWDVMDETWSDPQSYVIFSLAKSKSVKVHVLFLMINMQHLPEALACKFPWPRGLDQICSARSFGLCWTLSQVRLHLCSNRRG